MIIFGHTHEPVGWDDSDNDQILTDGSFIDVDNTGSWLNKRNKDGSTVFRGAEVFTYDTNTELHSVSITRSKKK